MFAACCARTSCICSMTARYSSQAAAQRWAMGASSAESEPESILLAPAGVAPCILAGTTTDADAIHFYVLSTLQGADRPPLRSEKSKAPSSKNSIERPGTVVRGGFKP